MGEVHPCAVVSQKYTYANWRLHSPGGGDAHPRSDALSPAQDDVHPHVTPAPPPAYGLCLFLDTSPILCEGFGSASQLSQGFVKQHFIQLETLLALELKSV